MSDQVDALVYAMEAMKARGHCKGCGVELDTLTAEADGLCRGFIRISFDQSRTCYLSFSTFAFRTGHTLKKRRYQPARDFLVIDPDAFGIDWTPEALVLLDQWLEQRTPLTPHVTPAE